MKALPRISTELSRLRATQRSYSYKEASIASYNSFNCFCLRPLHLLATEPTDGVSGSLIAAALAADAAAAELSIVSNSMRPGAVGTVGSLLAVVANEG